MTDKWLAEIQKEIDLHLFTGYKTSTAIAETSDNNGLSLNDIIEAYRRLELTIWYADCDWIERGTIYKLEADPRGLWPEYIICHPDDLKRIDNTKPAWIKLVHIRDWSNHK